MTEVIEVLAPRPRTVLVFGVAAAVAITGGVLLGHALTADAVAPTRPAVVVPPSGYPADWQSYRAGER
jgi:hypothetical protein